MGASNAGSGSLTIVNSTLTANTAQGGSSSAAGGGGSGYGGGLFNLAGSVVLRDDTLAANTVTGGTNHNGLFGAADGGAVYNLAFGNNINTGDPTSATLTLYNSILATSAGGTDLAGQIQGAGNSASVGGSTNLIMSTNLGTIPIAAGVITVPANPNLGPLQNNGGPTHTMALTASSPAFGAGNPKVKGGLPATDQRGLPRLDSGRLDLGAFELQLSTLPPPTSGSASSGGPPPSSSATATASQLSRVALDAFLVAEGIFTGNNLLIGLGAADVLFFTDGLPSDVRSQLLTAFTQDTVIAVVASSITIPS
jgi:hypothetical protein